MSNHQPSVKQQQLVGKQIEIMQSRFDKFVPKNTCNEIKHRNIRLKINHNRMIYENQNLELNKIEILKIFDFENCDHISVTKKKKLNQ